jgi:hypothetical protein
VINFHANQDGKTSAAADCRARASVLVPPDR